MPLNQSGFLLPYFAKLINRQAGVVALHAEAVFPAKTKIGFLPILL
jgi:hypothetical protein